MTHAPAGSSPKIPGGITGGADKNVYRYVGNDPVNHTDPTGLFQAGNPLANLPIPGVPALNPFAYAAPPLTGFGLPVAPQVSAPVAAPKYTTSVAQVVSQPAPTAGFFEKAANSVSTFLPWQSFPGSSQFTSFALKQNAKAVDAVVHGAGATVQNVRQVYDSVAAGEYSQAVRQHLAFSLGNASNSLVLQAVTLPGSPGFFQAAGPLAYTLNPTSRAVGARRSPLRKLAHTFARERPSP